MRDELIQESAREVEEHTGWVFAGLEYFGIFTVLCFRHELYTEPTKIPTVITAETEQEELQERLIEGLIIAEVMHSL